MICELFKSNHCECIVCLTVQLHLWLLTYSATVMTVYVIETTSSWKHGRTQMILTMGKYLCAEKSNSGRAYKQKRQGLN